ncbi:unnamed protein product [Linum trigynum]|uniref:Uncharacterized protein n=1 Tax=Linum trigynum TaxID=586398 RepID=A0AAV2GH10_9ROSI
MVRGRRPWLTRARNRIEVVMRSRGGSLGRDHSMVGRDRGMRSGVDHMGIDGSSEGIDGSSGGDHGMSSGIDHDGRSGGDHYGDLGSGSGGDLGTSSGGVLGSGSGGDLDVSSDRHRMSQPKGLALFTPPTALSRAHEVFPEPSCFSFSRMVVGVGDINLYRRWHRCGYGWVSTMITTLCSDTAKQIVCHPPDEAHIFTSHFMFPMGQLFDPLDHISLNHIKRLAR